MMQSESMTIDHTCELRGRKWTNSSIFFLNMNTSIAIDMNDFSMLNTLPSPQYGHLDSVVCWSNWTNGIGLWLVSNHLKIQLNQYLKLGPNAFQWFAKQILPIFFAITKMNLGLSDCFQMLYVYIGFDEAIVSFSFVSFSFVSFGFFNGTWFDA